MPYSFRRYSRVLSKRSQCFSAWADSFPEEASRNFSSTSRRSKSAVGSGVNVRVVSRVEDFSGGAVLCNEQLVNLCFSLDYSHCMLM